MSGEDGNPRLNASGLRAPVLPSAFGLVPLQTSYTNHSVLFLPHTSHSVLVLLFGEDHAALSLVSTVWVRVSDQTSGTGTPVPFTYIENDSCL